MNFKLLAIWVSIMLILWIILFYIVNMKKLNDIKETFIDWSPKPFDKMKFYTRKRNKKNKQLQDIKKRSRSRNLSGYTGTTQTNELEKKYNSQIQNLREKYNKQLDNLNKEIDGLKDNHEGEIQNLESVYNTQIDGLKDNHEEEIQNLEDSHTLKTQDLQQWYRNRMSQNRNSHVSQLQNLQNTHNQEKEVIKRSHKNMDILKYQTDELEKNYTNIDEIQGNIDTYTRKLNLLTTQTNELNKVAYIFKYITIISISLLIFMICIFVLNFDHIKGPSAIARGKMKSFFNKVKNKKIKI